MRSVQIQETAFEAGAELSQFLDQCGAMQAGAVCSFTGLMRDYRLSGEARQPLRAMRLEHYPGMTERVFEEVVAKTQEQFSLSALRVIHRYGLLQPNEAIVLVLAASEHREAAFAGCRALMERLKTDVPFWKCEYTVDGAKHWVTPSG